MKPVAHLVDPTRAELEASYRSLEQRQLITASCPAESLTEVLHTMEAVGFVAMTVNRGTLAEATVQLAAAKAKSGPCFDGGRSAAYQGAALAALDDDNHLLFGDVRVCEKTARVYGLDPYAGLMEVHGGDADLLAKIDSDPLDFDCNTYEDDLIRLLAALPEATAVADGFDLFYPGPFRLLVLADGSLLRRGEATIVDGGLAPALVTRDGCVELAAESAFAAKTAAFLPSLVAEQGSGALLGELPLERLDVASRALDLAALDRLSSVFAARLIQVIEHGDPMLVLTGSDPRDELGCCPSAEVGEALILVEAGVLSAHRSPTAVEACPVTVVAFADEIEVVDSRPEFTTNSELRASVKQRLESHQEPASGPHSPMKRGGRQFLTWFLLAFVSISLAFVVFKVVKTMTASAPLLVEVIGASETDRFVLCLFHSSRSCTLCSNLEAGARLALDQHLQPEVSSGALRFVVVDLDQPGNEYFKSQHRVFSSSLVLIELEGAKVEDSKTLVDAWALADQPEELAAFITSAVRAAPGD